MPGASLPDPGLLRATAADLGRTGSDLGERCAVLLQVRSSTRWVGPLPDVLDADLARGAAEAVSTVAGLVAGADVLRQLASAQEACAEAARRLHSAARDDLERRLRLAPPGPAAQLLQAELARLPGPDDPAWAGRAGARPPLLPDPPRALPVLRPPSPPGVLSARPAELHGLAGATLRVADAVAGARGGLARATAVDLRGGDAWGLGGGRTTAWLQDRASPLPGLEERLREVARRTEELAGLLERADRVLLPAPPAGLPPAPPPLPGRAPAPPGGGGLPLPGALDLTDLAVGLWQVPHDLADQARAEVDELVREARRLGAVARSLSGGEARAERRAAQLLLRRAREARAAAARLERLARRSHVPRWLRSASTAPLAGVRGLRHVTRSGVLGSLVGVVLDLRDGVGVPEALARAVAGLAAAAAVTALVAAAVLAAPVAVPAAAAVIAQLVLGTAAAVTAAWLVSRLAPFVGRQVRAVRRGLRWTGRRPAGTAPVGRETPAHSPGSAAARPSTTVAGRRPGGRRPAVAREVGRQAGPDTSRARVAGRAAARARPAPSRVL